MNRWILPALLVTGCYWGPPGTPPAFDPATQATPEDYGPAPTFRLTDQTGATRTEADFAGKVWVADFFFTSCTTICPALTAKMAALQVQYPQATFVSFSVDPGTDTPPVLAAYAERFHVKPGWYFLTGPVEEVRTIVTDGFKQAMQEIAVKPGESKDVIHGDRFIIVDRKGHMRGFPEAASPEVTEILTRVMAEAP